MERRKADIVTLNRGAATTVNDSRFIGCTGQAKLEQTQCLPLKGETVQGGQWGSVCLWRLASSVTPVWEPHILEVLYIFILWEGSFAFICITQEMINKMGEWSGGMKRMKKKGRITEDWGTTWKRATDKAKRNVLRTHEEIVEFQRAGHYEESTLERKAWDLKHWHCRL